MRYASFKLHKVAIALAIIGVLVTSVAATFAYKDMRFGDVHLVTALSRTFQKYSTLAIYALSFGDNVLAANAFSVFGTTEYKVEGAARAVPVLVYHGIHKGDNTSITPEAFADQMNTLHKAGWKTVTQDELEAFLRGEEGLPERSFLITFDDGARDSYYPTDPILMLLGYNAVNFVLPKYSVGGGTHYYLSGGEIENMIDSGRWEIGSHGHDSHEFLPINSDGGEGAALANLLWLPEEGRTETPEEFAARVTTDLRVSREELESVYGVTVDTFAFPFGEFGHLTKNYPEVVQVVANIADDIYSMSYYQTWIGEGFSQNYPQPNEDGMLMIKRIEPTVDTSAEELLDKLEDGIPKDLPYEDDFSDNKGWFSTWGKPVVSSSTLRLNSLNNESGAAVVLDGTADWQDYRLRAVVESPSQTGFVIWVRFQGNDNNAGCNFGNGFVHAEDIVDGERRVVNGTRDPSIQIPEGKFTVNIEVSGRELTCSVDDTTVTTPFLDKTLDQGGIGIKVWDPELGLAEAIIHSVTVEAL